MPTLSMFFGLIIRMYYAPKEHNPPHIHVYYQDYPAQWKLIPVKFCRDLFQQGSKGLCLHGLKYTGKSYWLIGYCAKTEKSLFLLNL